MSSVQSGVVLMVLEKTTQQAIDRDVLLAALRALEDDGGRRDFEDDHYSADQLLLRFIDDPEVADAFEKVGRWYA